LQPPDRLDLARWKHPGDHLADADRIGREPGGAVVVAGEQHRPQAQAAQPPDCLG